MNARHAVFAVTQSAKGGKRRRYRVGNYQPGNLPWERYDRLDGPMYNLAHRFSIKGQPVKWFAVRGEDDPGWNTAPMVRVQDVIRQPDRRHTVRTMKGPRWHVTDKWFAIVKTRKGATEAYGVNPIQATARARALARHRNLI